MPTIQQTLARAFNIVRRTSRHTISATGEIDPGRDRDDSRRHGPAMIAQRDDSRVNLPRKKARFE
jgi:hypothetical protein